MNCEQMFSHNLAVIRKHNRLTQTQFAEILGFNQKQYWNWESGHSVPNIEKLAHISSTVKISMQSLLTVDLNQVELI